MRYQRSIATLLALLFTLSLWAQSTDVSLGTTHQVKSLEYGAQSLQLRLEMIERAQTSIDIEYFIFDKSDAARLVVEALLRKKAENPHLRIRILIDYFSLSKNLDPYYSTALIEKGLEVKYYNNVALLDLARITHRTHRKLFVVDGREAITGGRNMASEYFDLKVKSNYLDRDIWIEGPIVESMVESFDVFWNHPRRVKVPKAPSRPARFGNDRTGTQHRQAMRRHQKKLRAAKDFASVFDPANEEHAKLIELRQKIRAVGMRQLATEPVFQVNSVRFLSDGPDWKRPEDRLLGKTYYDMLEAATSEVFIETPYFYLQDEEEKVFQRIREKGVQVSLLINSMRSSNEFAINYICLLEGLKFSRMGFDLYLFHGDWLSPQEVAVAENHAGTLWMQHSKTMLADGHISWIGTLNMDPRSVQRLNAENALVIYDRAFNARVSAHMFQRMGKSDHVVNGRRSSDGKAPHSAGLFTRLFRGLRLLPFYILENQI